MTHTNKLGTDHLSFYPAPAVMFFAISTFFELLCVLLYSFVFPKLPIVKYYRSKAASEGSKTVSADLAAGGIQIPSGGVQFLPFLSFPSLPFSMCHKMFHIIQDSAYNISNFFFQANQYEKEIDRKGNKKLLLENIDYALDLFLIYALTLFSLDSYQKILDHTIWAPGMFINNMVSLFHSFLHPFRHHPFSCSFMTRQITH